jgi:phosphohistidine phosphatase
MNIYLFRHGDAIELNQEIGDDALRYLTVEGRKKTSEVAEKLNELKVRFDIILTSPLLRAIQSAEITAATLKYKDEIKPAAELMGGHSFQKFHQLILRHKGHANAAYFGHAPDVNTFALRLLNKDIKELKINFKKSSVCCIDYDTDKVQGKLVWFLNADTMELLKGGFLEQPL